MRMIVIFHIDDYRVVYYTIIMAVYFTEIIYSHSSCILRQRADEAGSPYASSHQG